MACTNLIETIENGDCFCIALDITRSEAAIADPFKLQIKDIIPTFISSESFLDSAIFNLTSNENAHGGFSK